jgi:hypothetical protein
MEEKRGRNFVFTCNNYTDADEDRLKGLDTKYICWGREVGESGTPHLQGFVTFPNAKKFKQVIKLMPGCHIEIAQTIEPAIAYCRKEGVFFEQGTKPMNQADKGLKGKEHWEQVLSSAKQGNLDDIDAKTLISHYGTLKQIAKDYATKPPDLEECCGLWLWGEPGTGKSYSARNDYGDYYLKETNKWWDSYQGEDTVIVDEVELMTGKIMGHYLKKWADRYSFDAEVKGSKLIIRPKRIIVTSNYSIEAIFGEDAMMTAAIKRRFKTIHFNTVKSGIKRQAAEAFVDGFNPESHEL